MKFSRKNTTPLLLMGGSLVLLAGFLGIWLKDGYQDENDRLQEQTDFLFLKAVRGMEDELFQELLVKPVDLAMNGDPDEAGGERAVVQGQFDTTMMVFHQKQERGDSIVQISIRGRIDSVKNNEPIKGAMAFVVALSEGEHLIDSIPFRFDSLEILPMLSRQVEESFGQSELPRKVKLIRYSEEDSLKTRALLSTHYQDIVRGGSYAVEVDNYQAYLYKKMLPQALFALLLFATVALAFFVVYRNLLQQQRLTELKNGFIRNITHELKTPITTVGVAIEALQDFDALNDPAKTREYLDISKHELNRLSILVDKVLKMSQFEEGATDLKFSQTDLKTLTLDVLDSMQLHFERLGARVDLQTQGDDFSLEADPGHLTSVLYNLIDNALKYSKEVPVIHIVLSENGNELQLSIRDEGLGIPPEYHDKIFSPFFRVPTGDRHDVKGHGLGLNYVASVVRQHRGRIELDSRPGEGTLFTITLPRTHEPN